MDLVAVAKRANGQYWRIHGPRGSASLVESESMRKSPKIRSIEPPNGNWLNEGRLKLEISKIVEERRRGDSGEVSISGTVRSMLLEKWVLNIHTATIKHHRIFIPGWLINLETDKILHGRNGRLYDLVSLK